MNSIDIDRILDSVPRQARESVKGALLTLAAFKLDVIDEQALHDLRNDAQAFRMRKRLEAKLPNPTDRG